MIQNIVNKLNSNHFSNIRYRTFDAEDASLLNKIFQDENVMKFDGVLRGDEWIRGWIESQILSYEKNGFGHLALFSKQGEEFLGYCGLQINKNISSFDEIEIGYRIIFNEWGKGLATNAAQSMLMSAHELFNFQKVVAIIEPKNIGSINVATKLGFTYEREIMFDWYDYPDHLYIKTY